jgi:serine/threonine protein kinase
MSAPLTNRVPVHWRAYTNSRYRFHDVANFDTVAFPEAPRMAGTTQELKDLANLFREGLLTREEFDQQKQQLLAGSSSSKASGSSSPNVGDSVGAYRILGELGRGGMGVVYRAKHRTAAKAKRQGGEVAIKVLHAQYAQDEAYRDRFEREAGMGIKLNYPGIVKVYDLVIDGGNLALVMELAEGRPLSEVIGQETGPIPWEQAWPMFKQMLDAVAYAHDHKVVHRDIKPENVVVSTDNRLKILDFGIAKDLESGKTKTGTGMGTVDYMAPEQYTDASKVDQRADIYALGMTLYEMLAGRLPWDSGTTEFQVMTLKSKGDFPPPTDFYPEIPPAFVAVVKRATAVDIKNRFSGILAFKKELQSSISDLKCFEQLVSAEGEKAALFPMIRLTPGDFEMGPRNNSHKVVLSKPFEMGEAPVTEALYAKVLGDVPKNAASFKSTGQLVRAKHPVVNVSWYDAIRFCNAISTKSGLPPVYKIGQGEAPEVHWDEQSKGFRLPTEAEWEYAARAGKKTHFAGSDNVDEVAWTKRNSPNGTASVAKLKANTWGFYDMSGNVFEMCWDVFENKPIVRADSRPVARNPRGPKSGLGRVRRGGAWYFDSGSAWVYTRDWGLPATRSIYVGFRLARSL